jgi:hypothetical protein
MSPTKPNPLDMRWLPLETASLLVCMAWTESLNELEAHRKEDGVPFVDPDDGSFFYDQVDWTLSFLAHFEAGVRVFYGMASGKEYNPHSTVDMGYMLERVRQLVTPPKGG